MTFPSARTMSTLAALSAGREFYLLDDERMFVERSALDSHEVFAGELDDLIARAWVVAVGDRVAVTEAGAYWLGVYQRRVEKR